MSKLTVILPAAGKGTRLNLPYPKEIMKYEERKVLIDNGFDFFLDYGRKDVEFVVVINEHKLELVNYLSKYKDKFNISFTFQNPNEYEYTGAIKSARSLFGEHNVVLLPDTIMKLRPGKDLFTLVDNSLLETGFTFLYKKENNKDMLKTKGALFVNDEGNVIDYEDKPQENLDRYNAFWCAFAFRKRTFDVCMNFMEKSTLNLKRLDDEITNTPIFGSKGIEVLDYVDLGTWSEIRKLMNEKINT